MTSNLSLAFAVSLALLVAVPPGMAHGQEVPPWVKTNAGFWADGSVDDQTFVMSLEFLIENGIITIPATEFSGEKSDHVPSWVKTNAGFWADGHVSDADFVNGIQFLVANGIISVGDGNERNPMSLSGDFVSGDFYHQTYGVATIEFSGNGTSLHFSEDFETLNGPDLHVYLATDKNAIEYVDLGMIQRFSGMQSYGIPSGVDLERFDEVVIWCEFADVLFGSAHMQ